MVTTAIVAATFAVAVFAIGIAVGLGLDRFWWLVGCIWLAIAETFVAGCVLGEWVREQATKAWMRTWKR